MQMNGTCHRTAISARAEHRLGRDVRGVVFVEYAVIVAFVAIVMTLMLVALGPRVVAEYSARRGTLYDHSP
jgi:Flp pilus assembly pilin Flp